jgi:uncharacterized protein YjdB
MQLSTSTAKTAAISNGTTAAIDLSGLTAGPGGPFAIGSTTCGASLGAGKSCAISIKFSPATIGAASGALTAADTGTPASLSVALSGTGVYPVSLSPANVSLGSVALGSSSSKGVTLKNAGNTPLAINSVSTSANFTETNNCPISPNTLAAGGTCVITVVFTPAGLGAATATLSITHNAFGSPTIAALSGTGIAPVTLTPSSLTFAAQKIGSSSESRQIGLTNHQPGPLSISSIQTTGDFSQTNNCPLLPATLSAGASCSVTVKFTPTAAGTRTGQLSVNDGAVTSPQTAVLSGTGVAVLQTISLTPATATVSIGQTQQFTATGFYNDGSQQNLTASATWSSSRTSVATVSAGLVTGVSAGTATIKATQSGVSGTAALTVSSSGARP